MTRKHLWLRPVGWSPILALLQVVMSAAPAKAQTIIDWIDPNGGPYTNVANWSPLNVPNTTSETARFNIVGTYDVTFNANSTTPISDLLVNDGDVTFANGGINNDATLNISDDVLIDGGDLTLARLVGGTADVNLNITDFLQVNGGSTFSVVESAAVTANRMSIGTSSTGNGTIIVDGAGSSLIVSTLTVLGTSGSIGTLTFQNGSTGNSLSGTVNLMAGSGVAGSTGRLNVFGGSTLQTGIIAIGQSASTTLVQEGTLTVDGVGSTLTMTGASTLTVGDDINPNVVSDVIISDSGVMSSGTGAILIRNSGTFTITDGTFNANGSLTMTAGTTLTLDGGSLKANAGLDNSAAGTLDFRDGTLTVTGGAFQPNAGGPTDDYVIDGPTATEMPHLVLGVGATGSIGHDLFVGNANQGMLTFSGGGTFSNRAGLIGFDPNSIGMVTVDGSDPNGNASIWMNSSILTVGDAGDGTLAIQNGGAVSNTLGTIGDNPNVTGTVTVDGANSVWTNSSILIVGFAGNGTLTIQNGGTVSNTLLSHIASDPNSIGMVTVDGSDPNGNASTWTNSSFLVVGNAGNGTLNIQNSGEVSNVDDGFIGNNPNSIGTVTVDGAGSTWTNSISLYVGGNSASAGGMGTLNVQNGGLVEVDGTFKIWTDGTVNLGGGTLELNGPLEDGGGTFNFTSGVMNVNDATQVLVAGSSSNTVGGLVLGSSFVLGTGQTLNLAGSARVDLGGQLTLGGGMLNSPLMLVQPGGAVVNFAGSSTVTSPVLALAGSLINVTGGDLMIGDATVVNGFYSNGNLSVAGGSTLTLKDANDVAFDTAALVTLGNGTPGTLNAANGLTLDFGGNITGFGTVDTPNNSATPLINNGNITGNDPNEQITLTGYVKGVGTCDNCNITGTDAPGFSTAAVNRGSVSYNGTLEIEIGGLNPGSGYDQLNHILGAGVADLGGTLDVQLIGGFIPSLGDTFDILTAAGSVNGTFGSTLFPDIGALLAMDVFYDTNTVTLAVVPAQPGDFDIDGDVDGDDFLLWQLGGSPDPLSQSDLDDWEANYGAVAPLAATSTAVPEPATWIMLLFGMPALLFRRDVVVS